MASRNCNSDRRDKGDRPAVDASAEPTRGVVERSREERDADCKDEQPLDDAQRAGLQTDGELQVIAEGEHACADEKSGEVADPAGKEKLDHGGEPITAGVFAPVPSGSR
jgi:hypothetical protein